MLDLPADRAPYYPHGRLSAGAPGCVIGSDCSYHSLRLSDKWQACPGTLSSDHGLQRNCLIPRVCTASWSWKKPLPFLRNVAVAQFLQLISCSHPGHGRSTLFLFRGAKEIAGDRCSWGKMTMRSSVCVAAADLHHHDEHGVDGLHPFGVARRLAYLWVDAGYLRLGRIRRATSP